MIGVRLPDHQSASSACRYQALIGPNQATGFAGGFDLQEIAQEKRNTRMENHRACLNTRGTFGDREMIVNEFVCIV